MAWAQRISNWLGETTVPALRLNKFKSCVIINTLMMENQLQQWYLLQGCTFIIFLSNTKTHPLMTPQGSQTRRTVGLYILTLLPFKSPPVSLLRSTELGIQSLFLSLITFQSFLPSFAVNFLAASIWISLAEGLANVKYPCIT